ncbi:MAG: ferrous iron transport protein B [Brevinematales bacterium]|nr:ferrous iron transport protein B [Brevinematales bacterium]
MYKKVYKVGVVGAPNVGKTSLFNSLSGAREKVGNWSGTTVERVEKRINIDGKEIIFVDVPGTYSLSASSLDEIVARDFVLLEKPDLLVVVVSSVNLYNSLFLLTELLEMGFRIIVALNMYDVAKKNGIKIDVDKLSSIFGVKFIPTVGRTPRGVRELRNEVINAINNLENKSLVDFKVPYPSPIEKGISRILKVLEDTKVVASRNPRGVAIKILEENNLVMRLKVEQNNLSRQMRDIISDVDRELRMLSVDDIDTAIVRSKYNFIDKVLKDVIQVSPKRSESIQRKVDEILTSKLWGLIIFLGIMFGIFQLVYYIGDPIARLIEEGFSYLSETVLSLGKDFGWSSMFISFLTDGLISGVGSVLVFLPYIVVLFLFIGILENSGFLARSAVMMDRIMTTFGLHGKSFLPMLIGFGCNIPGIMATRVLSSFKDRLVTVLVLPLISCSARLTVFVVVTAALFKEYQGIILFMMYLLGIVLAGVFGIIFRRNIAKGEYSLFVMELPDFRFPSLRVLLSEMWYRSFMFVKKAGTVIASVVILVWLLGSLPLGVEYASGDSFLGIIGKTIQPVFSLTGFGDHWQVAVSILTAILAREVVIGTLGSVYGVSEEGITEVLPSVFTPLSAISFLVFMQVAMLCIATVVVIANEIGKKWAVFSFLYTITLAWGLSVLVYNVGVVLGL